MQGKKTLRMKFRMKMALTGRTGARVSSRVLMMGLVAGVLAAAAGQTEAQTSAPASSTSGAEAQATAAETGKLAAAPPVTYANKWEIYGGLNFMNFQAGQALPKRMNLGGGEVLGTYWLNKKLGISADYRGEAGTTPVLANPYANRPLVYMNMALFGAQYRGPKNQHFAMDYHAFGGPSYGVFDHTIKADNIPAQYNNLGLYGNKWAPMFALGGSVDFNQSRWVALRLQPDLILEHFGTETRVFFAISGGVVYRFGKK
jgi:hypothetical protein